MENYSYIFKIKGLRPLFTQGALSLKVFQSTVVLPWVKKPTQWGTASLIYSRSFIAENATIYRKSPLGKQTTQWGFYFSKGSIGEKGHGPQPPSGAGVVGGVVVGFIYLCFFGCVVSFI